LTVNGVSHDVEADPGMPLLWVLRDRLGKTGTKYGCGIAQCGACTVHLDGQPVRSCQTRIGDVGAAKITTIEGVSGRAAEAVQGAWRKPDVVQCG
ncbi:(2Fe-2S)-binding protein, partial [Methylobacterium sp. A54F]